MRKFNDRMRMQSVVKMYIGVNGRVFRDGSKKEITDLITNLVDERHEIIQTLQNGDLSKTYVKTTFYENLGKYKCTEWGHKLGRLGFAVAYHLQTQHAYMKTKENLRGME